MGLSGEAQDAANTLVDSAQTVANAAVDLGEEGAKALLESVIHANKLLGQALEKISEQLVD